VPYADPLTDEELATALAALDGWAREGGVIRRTVTCADFMGAVGLVNEVAAAAEAADHHPDIAITGYRHVRFSLSTHAANAITRRDTELAAEIDRIVSRIGAA
jgi:4a-hydroxytetrahydrobiopterin dehydratase